MTEKDIMTMISERDVAIQQRNLALSEKRAVLAQRDLAVIERDTALSERDSAIKERDQYLAHLQLLENISERGLLCFFFFCYQNCLLLLD